MKQVRVTELAFHDGTRVRPGTVLTVADSFSASWIEDVEPRQKVERQPRKQREAPVLEASPV
jgi:hypothetical protein